MMKINNQCRDCNSPNLIKFLDLGQQPPANSFLKADELNDPERTFPLEAYFCRNCNLAQLTHVVNKDLLFRNYIYFSAGMPKVSPYWQSYAEHIIANYLTADKNSLVVEIGSNDGILLKFFKDSGYKILGVDPAINIAKIAEKRGVPTLTEFFNDAVAKQIVKQYGLAMAIMGNNVVAHIDDHQTLCRGIKTLLHPNGIFVMEAPYLVDMFENLSYDTIYHEHLSFLAVRPLQKLFDKFSLEICDAMVVPSQGQSLRLFIGHKNTRPVSKNVQSLVNKELGYKLDQEESYFNLAKRVENSKTKLFNLLKDLKKQNKKIAAYGAPAKGNTLLNYCGIGTDILDYALEDLPSKQGLYAPGTHIPVVTRNYAETHLPDYYLLLAWNYTPAILEKEKEFREKGGKFIMPIGDNIKIL